MHRLALRLAALPLLLSGCIVLPFGVHVNRPFPMDEQWRIRLGVGLSQMPEGQGTVDAVNNDNGTAANPIPSGPTTAKLGTITADGTIGILKSLDLGFAARGVYLLWAPATVGHWVFSVSPAYGSSSADSNTNLTRQEKDHGTLGNLNLMGTAAWCLDPEKRERFFAYGGAAANLYSTHITVDEINPPYHAEGNDSGTAPTVLLGVGAKALGTVVNAELAETFLKERNGRSDAVLTVSLLLSWSFNFINRQAEAEPVHP